MSRVVHVLRTGLLSYSKALALQKCAAEQIIKAPGAFQNLLILTEHHPVYTIGLRTKHYTLDDEHRLQQLGAEFYRTNRGGLITFHGPGQLVAYPIVNLKNFRPSMKWFVCSVERSVIAVCAEFGLSAQTTADTGVWVDDRKICAIGVHGSRYVTTHGLALNCCTDLSWFEHIVPCGIEGKGVTSISQELGRQVTVDAVQPVFVKCFADIFGAHVKELDPSLGEQLIEGCS